MNDEELEQGAQGNGGGGGLASKVTNAANNVKEGAELGAKGATKVSEHFAKKAAKETGKTAAKKQIQSEMAKKLAGNLSKVAAKAGKVANIGAKLAPIIAWVAGVIIFLIIVIGLLVFVFTGLGLIMSGLKAIASDFFNGMYDVFFNAADNIPPEKIVDTMTYLEEMGYDLYGYGFVSKDAVNQLEEHKKNEDEPALIEETGGIGQWICNFTKNTLGVSNSASQNDYRNILAYLYSDNYAYLVRNSKMNPAEKIVSIVKDEPLGTGLISLYHDDGVGKIGSAYGSLEPRIHKS